jgi:integrase/recombinase XerC
VVGREWEGPAPIQPFWLLSRLDLAALFDLADGHVHRPGWPGARAGCQRVRDATLLKVAYGYGLRRNETRMLDVVHFGRNPHAPEFGDIRVCCVRRDKALKGSPPKRRSVLTVWAWVADVVSEWTEEIRPQLAGDDEDDNVAMWPSERLGRVTVDVLNRRLGALREELGWARAWTSTPCAVPTSRT